MGVMEGGGAGWFLAHWMTHNAPPMDALAVDPRRFGQWAGRAYRVDKAVECFGLQFGVHYPHEERPAGRNLRLSALHDLMLARGAVMGAAFGWERPNWFADPSGGHADTQSDETFRRANWFAPVASECQAVAERAALADLSVFAKFQITGPDTQAFLDTLGANTPPKTGRVGLIHALTPAGGVAAEFTVARLDVSRAYLTSATAAEEMDCDLLTAHAARHDVTVTNCTQDIAVIGLMGPASGDILSGLTSDALGPWLSVQDVTVAGTLVRAMRVSYVGELGWELHVPRAQACVVFEALEQAGQPYGIGYYGAYAANALRLEKGYVAWGSDLTTERTPLQTGQARFVQTEGRAFTGRAAMLARATSETWEMVLLEIEPGEVDPFYAHPVEAEGRVIGVVTSAAYGHRTGKVLAHALLRAPVPEGLAAGLSVRILGQVRRAKRLAKAPYDPDNLRLKAEAFKLGNG